LDFWWSEIGLVGFLVVRNKVGGISGGQIKVAGISDGQK
jgi:hypothetical protein